jgi:DNA-binding NtrC family response regulator
MQVQSVSDEVKSGRSLDGEGARPRLKELVADYERKLILSALNASGGHQRRAAASLGVLPTTLLEKMKRLGIHRTSPMPDFLSRTSGRF